MDGGSGRQLFREASGLVSDMTSMVPSLRIG